MRAVKVTRTDGPGAVEVCEVPDPVRGDEQILVEVRAAGVNFPDLLLTKDMYQYKPELPFVLGGEFAGVVREAAGSEFSPATGLRAARPWARSRNSSRCRRGACTRCQARSTSSRAPACR